jgi:hypothetical protein
MKKLSFDNVRKLGLALPNVEESTMYGSPALKVKGKLLACIAINKSAEPNSLGVRVDFDERDAMIAEAPDKYYVTDRYVYYPVVLARLSRIREDELRDGNENGIVESTQDQTLPRHASLSARDGARLVEGAKVQLSLPFIEVALGYNQGDVVMLFPRAEHLNFSNNRRDQGLGRHVTIALHCFNQPFLAEFFARRVERLRNSVGVQDERVSVKDVTFFYGALPFLEQSDDGAGGFKPFDFSAATKQQCSKMTAVGIA